MLRCVEEGRLSLDARISQFKVSSTEPDATLRQVLTHTSGTPENPVFAFRPERLDPLKNVIRACTDDSYRETLANRLVQMGMVDSVPGPDMIHPETLSEGIPDAAAVVRYTGVLDRLAIPYVVDSQKRASPSQYAATTLTPASGLISTVRDLAQFHLALKSGFLLRRHARAGVAGADRHAGRRLPHGLGWFVQSYNGETIAWQFGVTDNGSSSLWVTVPGRGLTLILLANSSGLGRPFNLAAGDLTVSPFARLFLGCLSAEEGSALGHATHTAGAGAARRGADARRRNGSSNHFSACRSAAARRCSTENASAAPTASTGSAACCWEEVFGVEGDFGFAPGFFSGGRARSPSVVRAAGSHCVLHSSVRTLTGNVVIAVRGA